MKHQAKGKKLGRRRNQRKALVSSLMNHFIKYGRIKTTEAKAKTLRPSIEKMITRAKTDTLANRRFLAERLTDQNVIKIMNKIGPKYIDRSGGYTRIVKLPPRPGDASKVSIIELV